MMKFTVLSALAAVSLFAQQQPARQPSSADVATSPAGGSVQDRTAPAVGPRRRAPERPKGPTPHLADGTVDLSGVWNGGGPIGDITQGLPKDAKLEMTPAAEKFFNSAQAKED